jgi:hypothetical protein
LTLLLGRILRPQIPYGYRNQDVADLMAFLESLTSPSLETLGAVNLPEDVPSGLPVDGIE